MSNTYPILHVEDVQPFIDKATLGLVTLQDDASHSAIEETLDAVADGTLPQIPEWADEFVNDAVAISYVHTQPLQWYGRISRGKFSPFAKHRLVRMLEDRRIHAFWLDQCLAQRRGDDANWAVLGLLPYAVMPALVIGNFHSLHHVLESYVGLERFPEEILALVTSDLEPLLKTLWSSCPASSDSAGHDSELVDFIEMCRFWPMMERALAHKAKGLFYEPETLKGLRDWHRILVLAHKKVQDQARSTNTRETNSVSEEYLATIITDLIEMVLYILMQRDDEDRCEGLGHNVLTALTIVTSALGSGAMTNAKLYQPEDRNALLLAGMCFNMLANTPSRRNLRGTEIVQVIEDPYRSFGAISERIPITYLCTANALVGANAFYSRTALDQLAVPHVGIADEVSIFSQATAQVPTSRRWNGQCELIPHLSLCMRAQLLDIGERSLSSEPYDDFTQQQSFSNIDITGKAVQAALCGAPLTEKQSAIPLIAISLFSATWTLQSGDKKIFDKYGLGGWTSRPLFLGLCDTIREKLYVEAMIISHMTVLEEDQLVAGRISGSSALNWLKALVRRSSCSLRKRTWILNWVSTNFDNVEYMWYNSVQSDLHHFTWEKWVTRTSPTCKDTTPLQKPVGNVRFVKLCRVTVESLLTTPQLPLEDVIRLVKEAIFMSQKSISHESSKQRVGNVWRLFIRRTFEIWLGLLSGLYHSCEVQDGIADASQLRLLLPGYEASNEMVKLCSERILDSGSGFIEGLSRTGPPSLEIADENGRHQLHWDMLSADAFLEVKVIVLDTAHVEGMMLTLMLVCFTTATCEPRAGSSSTDADVEAEQGLSSQGSEHALDNKIDRAIRELCKNLASRGAQDVIYALIEHVITNTRLPRAYTDWRIHPEFQKVIRETVTNSGSSRSTALSAQVNAVFESLENIHKMMSHIQKARLKLEPGQSLVDGTESSFNSMLRALELLQVDTGQPTWIASEDDALRHNDYREVIHTRGADVNSPASRGAGHNRLAVTLEFVERLQKSTGL